MKWIAISGGWRKTNNQVEKNVRKIIKEIMNRGDGIISGGALGIDSIALNEALKHNPKADRIKIFLPSSLRVFSIHYRKRAREGVITKQQAESLIAQLKNLKKINPRALIEVQNVNILNKEIYYKRNTAVIEAADALIAFHIKSELSEGLGTKDTIEKARQKSIPVKVFSYNLIGEK